MSLVGTDANTPRGKGIPRSAFYFYDIRSKMELEHYGIHFMSAQDLEYFHDDQNKRKTIEFPGSKPLIKTFAENEKRSKLKIYGLVEYFMKHHQYGSYFLDEVPLLKGIDTPGGCLLKNNCFGKLGFLMVFNYLV